MYNITINKSTTLPLFQQIKEDISSKIKNGEYVSGHKIPTEL